MEFFKTTRDERQLLNDQYLYNESETGNRSNTWKERKNARRNVWREGVIMGVELELLLISMKIFLN